MALVDARPDATPPVTLAADVLRQRFAALVVHAESVLQQTRGIVRDCGRAALAGELGAADAVALASAYKAAGDFIKAAKDITVEDLPE